MKVSVIISNYNYAQYLSAAVDSVLMQTYKDIEIILVDDGSKDNSHEAIEKLQQKAPNIIRAIFQTNQGQGAAFNTGLEAASGDVVAFLDADDVWKPNKLERIVETFSQSDCVGVMHQMDNIDGNGNLINPSSKLKKLLLDEDLAKIIVETGNAWNFPPTSGLAYRRSILKTVFPIGSTKWRLCADGCLIYCTAFLGKIKTLNEVLGSYRIHGKNNFSIQKTKIEEDQKEEQNLLGIEMTNQYINEYLQRIGYPRRVDLSKNLQYRRTVYYRNGKWNAREMLAISRLILGWRFYTTQERVYYLARFLMKNVRFLLVVLNKVLFNKASMAKLTGLLSIFGYLRK